MEPLTVYNKTYKLVQSIYSSRLKIQILLSVFEGTKTLSELRDVTGSTSQALIPKIRSLEYLALIEAKEHGYVLTPIGKIIGSKIRDFILTQGELMQHRDFWATHDLEGIPQPFLQEIGDLISSDLTFDTTDNIFHVYSNYLSILAEASSIRGISSVMSAGLADALAGRVIAGIPIELIVNRTVAESLMQEPFISKLRSLVAYKHFQIWITDEPLRLGITVTDKKLSFGLNKKETGTYDSSADLNSSDPKALEWAQHLFQYYKERSTLLTL